MLAHDLRKQVDGERERIRKEQEDRQFHRVMERIQQRRHQGEHTELPLCESVRKRLEAEGFTITRNKAIASWDMDSDTITW